MNMKPMRWGNPDLEAGAKGEVDLPCGARGFIDGCGYRCMDCFAIYGSVACPCTSPSSAREGGHK